jgi:hypothetical protein
MATARPIPLSEPVMIGSNWVIYYFRGICFERAKQWPKAEADFKRSLDLFPDNRASAKKEQADLLTRWPALPRRNKEPRRSGARTTLEQIEMKMCGSDSANLGCFEATQIWCYFPSKMKGMPAAWSDKARREDGKARNNPNVARMAETSAASVRFPSGALSAKK